ncbi:hypothetical protein ACP0HM_28100 [Escherichia coli]
MEALFTKWRSVMIVMSPHLLARDKKGKLVQWENKGGDEFSLQDEVPVEHDATAEKKLKKRTVSSLR